MPRSNCRICSKPPPPPMTSSWRPPSRAGRPSGSADAPARSARCHLGGAAISGKIGAFFGAAARLDSKHTDNDRSSNDEQGPGYKEGRKEKTRQDPERDTGGEENEKGQQELARSGREDGRLTYAAIDRAAAAL